MSSVGRSRVGVGYKAVLLISLLALVAAACGGGNDGSADAGGGGEEPGESEGEAEAEEEEQEAAEEEPSFDVQFPAELVEAARQAAIEAAGTDSLGGTVGIEGHNGGFEEALVIAALDVFAEATGVDVQYTGGRNLETRIETRVRAGDPPDIAQESGAGNLRRYADEGLLLAVDEFIDGLEDSYSPGMLASGMHDGRIYSPPSAIHATMVWFNPNVFDGREFSDFDELIAYSQELVAAGRSPWCMGLDAGDNTPVPAAYFVEQIFARTHGAEALARWSNGDIPFNSPEVREAFELFGRIGSDPAMVYGGMEGALATPAPQGPVGLYEDPPNCEFLHWGSYTGNIIRNLFPELDRNADIDFFTLPSVNPAYQGHEAAHGWAVYAFNDTPQVRAMMTYWASAEFQALLASGGSWVMANSGVDQSAYPADYLRKAADRLLGADDLAYGPFYSKPTRGRQAFLRAVADYMLDPGSLERILDEAESAASSR